MCVPWGDTPFASDYVGVTSSRSDVEFADGGYLEPASTTVISTKGEMSDSDMIEQYDMAIDWARSDETPTQQVHQQTTQHLVLARVPILLQVSLCAIAAP